MKLNFNLDNIEYLALDYLEIDEEKSIKLALKEKREDDFVAIVPLGTIIKNNIPSDISLSFICHDGLYKTSATLKDIYDDEEYTYFVIQNPDTLDYQQNREYYRILVDYDCIYTIDTGSGIESFNARTYDISMGGVSIITSENIIPTRETSIVICLPDRDLKAYLKFVRCEAHGEDEYKLSFTFVDLDERNAEYLSDLCVQKQIHTF